MGLLGRARPGGWRTRARAALLGLGLAAAGALAAHLPDAPEAASASSAWNVVMVRGWDSLYINNLARETAMRDAILDKSPRPVEFFPEEIDPLRFPAAAESDLAELLQSKYRRTRIDAVIASSPETLQFVARHRDEIWPGAAIVFNSVYEGGLKGWKRPPKTAGITIPLDVEGTVALGRRLVPGVRTLYVVSGSGAFDRHLRDLVLERLARITPPLDVRRIDGLTREDTAEHVAGLEPNALVLYVTMLRDGAGKVSGPSTPSLTLVAGRSRVPVLSVIQSQFRRGPVGGSAPRYDLHGRAAGLLVRRVLEGADPDAIPIRSEPLPVCEVDWNAMERWKVPEANVPEHCRIANRPPELTGTHLWQIAGLLVVILLQAALIGTLVLQSRRRRRAESELQLRSAELAQAQRLSMVGALTASIAHEINQPMGAILSNAEAAEMMLEQNTLDTEKLREILADIRTEDLRASEVIRSLRKLLARKEWKPVPLDLNAEVAEALQHVAFEAARYDVRLAPVFGAALPAVMGEPAQLQQVVINLVLNAMQAIAGLPPSRREVRIETLARPDGVEIVVADHGPGLEPRQVEQLFHVPFTGRKDGMGFGLSIVRSAVEHQRGRVWFEPNVPEGAMFHVWLPAVGT